MYDTMSEGKKTLIISLGDNYSVELPSHSKLSWLHAAIEPSYGVGVALSPPKFSH